MHDTFYSKHYIITRQDGAVIDAWSNGPHPEKDTTGAICINEKGGYQFRLYSGGEENPPIHDECRIPLYKWDGSKVIPRAEEEIAADRAAIPEPPPSEQERLRADVDFLYAIGGYLR